MKVTNLSTGYNLAFEDKEAKKMIVSLGKNLIDKIIAVGKTKKGIKNMRSKVLAAIIFEQINAAFPSSTHPPVNAETQVISFANQGTSQYSAVVERMKRISAAPSRMTKGTFKMIKAAAMKAYSSATIDNAFFIIVVILCIFFVNLTYVTRASICCSNK